MNKPIGIAYFNFVEFAGVFHFVLGDIVQVAVCNILAEFFLFFDKLLRLFLLFSCHVLEFRGLIDNDLRERDVDIVLVEEQFELSVHIALDLIFCTSSSLMK